MKRTLLVLLIAAVGAVFLPGCASGPTGAGSDPTADAGPDQTLTDNDGSGTESVALDGTASTDPDGAIERYAWSRDGSEIALGPNPVVDLPVGLYVIRLTVMDADGATSADDVLISILAQGAGGQPVASAGVDQTVTDSDGNGVEAVTLDGSSSTDPGPTRSISNWSWTENGQQIAQGASPTVNLAVGSHTITLTVTNDQGAVDTDDVVVTVVGSGGNQPPTANAGPDQTLTDVDGNGSEMVTLNGSGSSDSDGSVTGWAWSESGSQIATGSGPTVALGVGSHSITLTVTDNSGATGTDVVVITVSSSGGNQPPAANAGPDQTVTDADGNGSETVSLDGSGSSDPDGSINFAAWKENGQTLGNGQFPSVTLSVGVHTITLTVTDNQGATGTDDVVITVQASGGGNTPPNANAGPDQTVTDSDGSGAENVTLNGNGSSDSDGTVTSWVWREGGSQIATGSSPTVPFTVGSHTVQLTVTDDGGATATDTVVITVNAGGGAISYAADIQPYFNAHCTSCHSSPGPDSGLDLTSYSKLMAGGNSGPAVTPGDSSQSILIVKLQKGHHGAPHGTTIIQDATSWINAGAPNN